MSENYLNSVSSISYYSILTSNPTTNHSAIVLLYRLSVRQKANKADFVCLTTVLPFSKEGWLGSQAPLVTNSIRNVVLRDGAIYTVRLHRNVFWYPLHVIWMRHRRVHRHYTQQNFRCNLTSSKYEWLVFWLPLFYWKKLCVWSYFLRFIAKINSSQTHSPNLIAYL